MVASWVCTSIKTHQSAHFQYMLPIIHSLVLSKINKLSWTRRILYENQEVLRWGLALILEWPLSNHFWADNSSRMCYAFTCTLCLLNPWKKKRPPSGSLTPSCASLPIAYFLPATLEPSHIFQPQRLCTSCSCCLKCSSVGSLHHKYHKYHRLQEAFPDCHISKSHVCPS